jgi:hypothetical protein
VGASVVDLSQRMATEMQAVYIEHVTTQRARLTDRPKALQELDARLAKLRDMQRASPDMADELQAAVDRAKSKRRELENAQPAAKQSAKLLMLVPRMAEEYRRQIELGLDGNPRAALKSARRAARTIPRRKDRPDARARWLVVGGRCAAAGSTAAAGCRDMW